MAIFISCGKCPPVTHQVVFEVLRHPAGRSMSFLYGRLTVDGPALERIASGVAGGRIGARHAPSDLREGAGAKWSIQNDELVFRRQMPGAGTVIHEAVHGLQDEIRYPRGVTEAEAIANVAEAYYRLLRAKIDFGSYAKELASIKAGSPIDSAAADVVVRMSMVTRSYTHLVPADIRAVEQAIANHDLYKDKADAYQFNGIRP